MEAHKIICFMKAVYSLSGSPLPNYWSSTQGPPPPFPSSPGEKRKFLFSKTIVEYHTFFMFFFVKIAFKLKAPFLIERLKRTLLHTQHIVIVGGDFSQSICIGSKLYVKRYETGFSII